MACPGSQTDWDEDLLSLGNPKLMDNATFLEWSTRQMETDEEREQRLAELDRRHREWHSNMPHYISACYIYAWAATVKTGYIPANVTKAVEF